MHRLQHYLVRYWSRYAAGGACLLATASLAMLVPYLLKQAIDAVARHAPVGELYVDGLWIVLVGGAELFTGNNPIVMAWASSRISTREILRNWAIVRRHALRNSLLPISTLIALSLGYVIGGAILVETVFSYPGIGLLTYNAIAARDYPLLQASFLFLTLSVVLANYLADLLYFKLDPRITT